MHTKCADRFAGLAFAVISAASASADAGMSFMEPLIVPRPSQIEVQTNVCVSLSAGPVCVSCAEGGSSALPWAADSFGTIAYATHLRHVGWDMGLKSRESTGFVTDDVPVRPWVEAVGGKCLE